MFRRKTTVNSLSQASNTQGYPTPNTDAGGYKLSPDYGSDSAAAQMPMEILNGCEYRKPNRQPSQSDVDVSPWLARRYTNMSVTDVQLINGLQHKIASGRRINYMGAGYLWNVAPIIPGQTRDNAAGFHRRGPSPYNVGDIWADGPGSQPAHPGGPGKIAAPTFINPMSG